MESRITRPREPTFWAFATAYVSDGLTLMSGPVGAIFGGVGVFSPNDWAKGAFLLLAIVCFGAGAYRVWKQERSLSCALNDQLRPRVRLDYDEALTRCFHTLPDGSIHAHILIDHFSGVGALEGAQVFLQRIEISQDGKEFKWVERWRTALPISLCLYGIDEPEKFKPVSLPADETLADIVVAHPKEFAMIDNEPRAVFRVEVSSKHDAWRFFWESGIYRLTLRLTASLTKSEPLQVLVRWDGVHANLKVARPPVPSNWLPFS